MPLLRGEDLGGAAARYRSHRRSCGGCSWRPVIGEAGADPDPGEAGRVRRSTGAETIATKQAGRDESGDRAALPSDDVSAPSLRRSTVYAARDREESDGPAGLKTARTEDHQLEEIRRHSWRRPPKVRASSDPRGSKRARLQTPVLRLMRENGLLAPVRKHPRGDRSQAAGSRLCRTSWGCSRRGATRRRMGGAFFVAVDHCVTSTWRAALEPIRQGVRTHNGYAPKIALGLGLRHDWGPQYTISSKESWPGSGSARRPRT